jgi:hypothetical protein
MTMENNLPQSPKPVADLAARFGISKERLYSIALSLDASGNKEEARDVRAAADYLEELMQLSGAEDVFYEVMAEWGRQNEPIL